MDWVEILGLGASAASGGLFGVLGAAFGAWMKQKERKQKAQEKKEERDHQKEMIKLQMEVTSQGGTWDAMTTTHQAETALNLRTTSQWVADFKSLFRPVLTLFLWIAVFVEMNLVLTGTMSQYLQTASLAQTLFSQTELISLFKYIVYSTVFSATTATTWWFGERALSLPELKNR